MSRLAQNATSDWEIGTVWLVFGQGSDVEAPRMAKGGPATDQETPRWMDANPQKECVFTVAADEVCR